MNEGESIDPLGEEQEERDRIVRALARRHVIHPQSADDLAQQVWLAALSLSADRRPSKELLGTLARRIAIDGFRAQRLRRTVELLDTAGSAGVDEQLVANEARRLAVDAVARLEEPYRQAIRLRFLEERSPRDIALQLGIPLETVNTRVKRGLVQLRAQLVRRTERGRSRWALLLLPLRRPARGLATAASVLFALVVASFVLSFSRRSPDDVAPLAQAPPPEGMELSALPRSPRTREAVTPLPVVESAGFPGRRVTGRVVHSSGLPAAHAEVLGHAGVTPVDALADEPVARVRCAADGSFVLAGLPARFVVAARAPGQVSSEILVAEHGPLELELVHFELRPATIAKGSFVGASAGSAMMVAHDGTRPARAEGAFYEARSALARLDGAGRFELGPLCAGRYTLLAAVPGFARQWHALELPAPELQIELERGTDLEVQVLTAAGTPASGLVVECQQVRPADAPLVGKGWLGLEEEARTDAQGRCRFAARRGGSDTMITVRDGERNLRVVFPETPLEAQLVLRLDPERVLAGRVIDEGGRAVPGAELRLLPEEAPADYGSRGFSMWRQRLALGVATTDASGRFRIPHAPSAPVRLEVRDTAGTPLHRQSLLGHESELEIRVPAAREELSLLVLARATGLPIGDYELLTTTSAGRAQRRRIQDAGGRGSLARVTGERAVAAVWAPGHALRRLSEAEFQEPSLSLWLEAEREVELQLRDRADRPLREGFVRVLDRDGHACLMDAGNGQARDALAPGADGSLLLRGVPAAPLVVEVWVPTCVEPERFELDATLAAGPARLRVESADQQAAASVLALEILREDGRAWTGRIEIWLRDAAGHVAVHLRGALDAQGFRCESPPAVFVLGQGRRSIFSRPPEKRWMDDPDVLSRLPWLPGGTLELRHEGSAPRTMPLDAPVLRMVLPER